MIRDSAVTEMGLELALKTANVSANLAAAKMAAMKGRDVRPFLRAAGTNLGLEQFEFPALGQPVKALRLMQEFDRAHREGDLETFFASNGADPDVLPRRRFWCGCCWTQEEHDQKRRLMRSKRRVWAAGGDGRAHRILEAQLGTSQESVCGYSASWEWVTAKADALHCNGCQANGRWAW